LPELTGGVGMPAHYDFAAYVVSGHDWTAFHRDGYILLGVAPTYDVADAIATMFPPERQHLWTVESVGEDTNGWDLYRLERVRQRVTARKLA
jgi:hypothetical protein